MVQCAEVPFRENKENVDDELRVGIEAAVEDMETVLEDNDASMDEFEDATGELSRELQETGKRMY